MPKYVYDPTTKSGGIQHAVIGTVEPGQQVDVDQDIAAGLAADPDWRPVSADKDIPPVKDLRAEAKKLGVSTTGKKAALHDRVVKARAAAK